jgi:hypothetical protein
VRWGSGWNLLGDQADVVYDGLVWSMRVPGGGSVGSGERAAGQGTSKIWTWTPYPPHGRDGGPKLRHACEQYPRLHAKTNETKADARNRLLHEDDPGLRVLEVAAYLAEFLEAPKSRLDEYRAEALLVVLWCAGTGSLPARGDSTRSRG